ncbi:MAG TPA: PA2779 family protein [Moraxellaceae bacterium]|nr:PA2779 family protein [Moraxellaceae bacterium]
MKRHTLKITATLLVASMGLTSLPVQAMSISTQEAIELTAAVDGRVSVNAFLARADVQAELARYGVDPAQAAERVAALSDAEIAVLNQRVGDTAAGGSVVGAIVFIFVVLLVTDILGLTKVFPFTRSVR